MDIDLRPGNALGAIARATRTNLSPDTRLWLTLILVPSVLLRLALIARGGQDFLPDELRFERGLRFLADGPIVGWQAAAVRLLSYPDHTLFGVVSVPAAILGQVAGLQAAAAALSLASVANVVLVYALARRAGADSSSALIAAFLMAMATSMTYYAQHLLPYDLSLCLLLLALLIGLGPGTRRHALASGALVGAAFLTYNGYWAGAAAALIVPLIDWLARPRTLIGRIISTGLGFAAPLATLAVLNVAWDGPGVLAEVSAFARSVTMGDAAEGWSLPPEYLWHTEHLTSVVWIIGCAGLVLHAATRRKPRELVWIGAALGIYGLLVVTSSGLGYFTVAARHARQVVLFLCLAAAPGLRILLAPRSLAALCGVIVLQAAANVVPLWAIEYPATFQSQLGDLAPARTWSVAGPPDEGDPHEARCVLVNVGIIWPVLGRRELPPGRTVAQASQPLEFWPYQYEGYRPEERTLIRSTDISMRLIETSEPRSLNASGQ